MRRKSGKKKNTGRIGESLLRRRIETRRSTDLSKLSGKKETFFLGRGGKRKANLTNQERKAPKKLDNTRLTRTTLRQLRKEEREPTRKEASRLARSIYRIWGQTWNFRTLGQRDEAEQKVEEKYKQARREWNRAMRDKERRRQQKLGNKSDQDVVQDIMNEKQGSDPAIVKNPDTGEICNKPEEVKKIFKETLQLKTGTSYGKRERVEKIWWEEEMKEENEALKGTFSELERNFTKEEVLDQLTRTEYRTAPGRDGVSAGLLKMIVKHAPEKDQTNLAYLTEVLNLIWNSGGSLNTHKEGIGKLIWRKKETSRQETSDL